MSEISVRQVLAALIVLAAAGSHDAMVARRHAVIPVPAHPAAISRPGTTHADRSNSLEEAHGAPRISLAGPHTPAATAAHGRVGHPADASQTITMP